MRSYWALESEPENLIYAIKEFYAVGSNVQIRLNVPDSEFIPYADKAILEGDLTEQGEKTLSSLGYTKLGENTNGVADQAVYDYLNANSFDTVYNPEEDQEIVFDEPILKVEDESDLIPPLEVYYKEDVQELEKTMEGGKDALSDRISTP